MIPTPTSTPALESTRDVLSLAMRLLSCCRTCLTFHPLQKHVMGLTGTPCSGLTGMTGTSGSNHNTTQRQSSSSPSPPEPPISSCSTARSGSGQHLAKTPHPTSIPRQSQTHTEMLGRPSSHHRRQPRAESKTSNSTKLSSRLRLSTTCSPCTWLPVNLRTTSVPEAEAQSFDKEMVAFLSQLIEQNASSPPFHLSLKKRS